ncbi:hypothetical protein [Streptomyces sp. NPDC058240]|uniref:hypothetical protein n=1 Tax=Streptomyces sp. NPDC058240 TaxID=3346396 RepID=UPI0036EF89E8
MPALTPAAPSAARTTPTTVLRIRSSKSSSIGSDGWEEELMLPGDMTGVTREGMVQGRFPLIVDTLIIGSCRSIGLGVPVGDIEVLA